MWNNTNLLSKKLSMAEKVCPVCKKTFIVQDCKSWGYRIYKNGKRDLVCSWHCLQKYESTHNTRSAMRKKRTVERQLRGEM